MFDRLAEMFPTIAEDHLSALAETWSFERDQIIDRMLNISGAETGLVMASDARPEAIFELAKLITWLEGQIIAKKLKTRPIENIDPNEERAALQRSAAAVQELVEVMGK